jgi:hypothetical protein
VGLGQRDRLGLQTVLTQELGACRAIVAHLHQGRRHIYQDIAVG